MKNLINFDIEDLSNCPSRKPIGLKVIRRFHNLSKDYIKDKDKYTYIKGDPNSFYYSEKTIFNKRNKIHINHFRKLVFKRFNRQKWRIKEDYNYFINHSLKYLGDVEDGIIYIKKYHKPYKSLKVRYVGIGIQLYDFKKRSAERKKVVAEAKDFNRKHSKYKDNFNYKEFLRIDKRLRRFKNFWRNEIQEKS